MKRHYYFLILSIIICPSCADQSIDEQSTISPIAEQPLVVPPHQIAKSKLTFNRFKSLWLLDTIPYSGTAVTHYDNGTLKEKIGMLNGRKQNASISYFPDGHPQSHSSFYKGQLHGEKKSWSPDSTHILLAHLHFHLGKAAGEQRKWYPTGELFQILNMSDGKEEGLQRAYRKNGDLYANYEAKNGRIFGLKKAALCFSLEDEKFENEE